MLMKEIKKILLLLPLLAMLSVATQAQVVVGGNDEYGFDYLTPKTYEIGGITLDGADNFDSRVVLLVAGLQVGDRVKIPGDKISTAIENLWKQGMFEDVQIRVTRIQGNIAFLKIVLKERPRMLRFAFKGVEKARTRNCVKKSTLKQATW